MEHQTEEGNDGSTVHFMPVPSVYSCFRVSSSSPFAHCNHSCYYSNTGTAESHMLIDIGLQCVNGHIETLKQHSV